MGESGRCRRPIRLGGFSGEKPEAASPAFRREAFTGLDCLDGGVTPWRQCGVGFCSSMPGGGASTSPGLVSSSGLPGLPSGASEASAGPLIGGGLGTDGLGTDGLGTDGGPAPARMGGERIGPAPNRPGGELPSCDEIRPCTQEVVGADTMPEGGDASAA